MEPVMGFMGFIKDLVNIAFFLVVAITILASVWLSRKYKERYAEFPWWKAGVLVAVEVVVWVVFVKLLTHWWFLVGGAVLMIIILMMRKKKKEQIL
jgi:amino acid transporter